MLVFVHNFHFIGFIAISLVNDHEKFVGGCGGCCSSGCYFNFLVYRMAGWVGCDDDVEEPGGWL